MASDIRNRFGEEQRCNAILGRNVFAIESDIDRKLILLGGLEGLIVVNTADAIMISKKENRQRIKDYIEEVKSA